MKRGADDEVCEKSATTMVKIRPKPTPNQANGANRIKASYTQVTCSNQALFNQAMRQVIDNKERKHPRKKLIQQQHQRPLLPRLPNHNQVCLS